MAISAKLDQAQRTAGTARLLWNKLTPTRGAKVVTAAIAQESLRGQATVLVRQDGLYLGKSGSETKIFDSAAYARCLSCAGITEIGIGERSEPQIIKRSLDIFTDSSLGRIKRSGMTVTIENSLPFTRNELYRSIVHWGTDYLSPPEVLLTALSGVVVGYYLPHSLEQLTTIKISNKDAVSIMAAGAGLFVGPFAFLAAKRAGAFLCRNLRFSGDEKALSAFMSGRKSINPKRLSNIFSRMDRKLFLAIKQGLSYDLAFRLHQAAPSLIDHKGLAEIQDCPHSTLVEYLIHGDSFVRAVAVEKLRGTLTALEIANLLKNKDCGTDLLEWLASEPEYANLTARELHDILNAREGGSIPHALLISFAGHDNADRELHLKALLGGVEIAAEKLKGTLTAPEMADLLNDDNKGRLPGWLINEPGFANLPPLDFVKTIFNPGIISKTKKVVDVAESSHTGDSPLITQDLHGNPYAPSNYESDYQPSNYESYYQPEISHYEHTDEEFSKIVILMEHKSADFRNQVIDEIEGKDPILAKRLKEKWPQAGS